MFFGNFIFDRNKNFVIVKVTQYMHVIIFSESLVNYRIWRKSNEKENY